MQERKLPFQFLANNKGATVKTFRYGIRETPCGAVAWCLPPSGRKREKRFRNGYGSAKVSAKRWIKESVQVIKETQAANGSPDYEVIVEGGVVQIADDRMSVVQTRPTASDFAEKLAAEILTVAGIGGDVECERAQMMKKQDDGTEKEMGGRNKASLVRLIERRVRERFGEQNMNDEQKVRDGVDIPPAKVYPSQVCANCGLKHGRGRYGLSSWNPGTCDICGGSRPVTEPRDFGHLKDTWEEEVKKRSEA